MAERKKAVDERRRMQQKNGEDVERLEINKKETERREA
jgi:hypothetical protein